MKKYICFLVLFLTFVSGCSSDNAYTRNTLNELNPEPVLTNEEQNISQKIWEDFAENSSLMDIPHEPDLYLLYKDGLTNDSAYVRWYSACKILEYVNDEKKLEITDLLNKLTTDDEDYVRSAAAFSLSVVNKSFEGKQFFKSPDGENIAFSRFSESKYNNGEIWIYNKPNDSYWLYKKVENGAVGELIWSPDSKAMCISTYGQTWRDVGIIDIDIYSNEHTIYWTQIGSYIVKNKSQLGYKIGQNQRADFYIGFLEWKPDSSKILLSYNFTDDDYIEQSGIVIYNIKQKKIEGIEKYKGVNSERPKVEKPLNIKW